MFAARIFYLACLLIGFILIPGIFSAEAFSYFYSDSPSPQSATKGVNYLTITDQMKILENYNQDHAAKKNEVSVKWVSKKPIKLNACFKHASGLSTIPPSGPKISITGGSDDLKPSVSSVLLDNQEHYYFSVRLNLKETGHIILSNIDTRLWVLDSGCSGIHTDDDRRISSKTLVVLSSAAPPNEEQGRNEWSQAASVDQSQSSNGPYSTGGGWDDSGDDFKKKPGDSFRPLAFFEYTSKLGINLIPMASSHGNTLQLRHKYVLQMNVVLTLFQNGNVQEVHIPTELWQQIRQFGRYLDPQLACRLAGSPFDLQQAYQDYLRESPKQRFPYPESYVHWLLTKLPEPMPDRVSILPGSAPSPVGHPGGGSTKGGSNADSTVSGERGAAGSFNHYCQWVPGAPGGGSNDGNDGNGWDEKPSLCQSCAKIISRPICGQLLCRKCYANSKASPAPQKDTLPNIETQESRIHAQLLFTATPREVQTYQWLLELPREEVDRTLFTLKDYNLEILYQELSYQLRSKPNLLNRLTKIMAEVAAGSATMKDLLIEVGGLAGQNGLDPNRVVSGLLLTIARYSSELLRSDTGISNAGRLRLKDKLLSLSFSQDDFDNAKLHPVSVADKDRMRTYVYDIFQELADSMGTVQIPITARFLEHLDELFRTLFEDFFFGVPTDEIHQMDLWGVAPDQRFINEPYRQNLHQPLRVNLSDLSQFLRLDNFSAYVSTLYMAGVVLGYGLGRLSAEQLPDTLQPDLQNFISEARRSLRAFLAAEGKSGRMLTDYMLSVFGLNLDHLLSNGDLNRPDLSSVPQEPQAPPTLDSYITDNHLIKKIAEDMGSDNVSEIVFLLDIPAKVQEEIKGDSLKLFKHLSQESDYTYGSLIKLLENIHRHDLINLIKGKYPQMK